MRAEQCLRMHVDVYGLVCGLPCVCSELMSNMVRMSGGAQDTPSGVTSNDKY